MSIQTELTRITNAKSAIKAAIEGKGVTVPDATLLDGMASLIESIEAGGDEVFCGSFTPTSDVKTFKITSDGGAVTSDGTNRAKFGVLIAEDHSNDAVTKNNYLSIAHNREVGASVHTGGYSSTYTKSKINTGNYGFYVSSGNVFVGWYSGEFYFRAGKTYHYFYIL